MNLPDVPLVEERARPGFDQGHSTLGGPAVNLPDVPLAGAGPVVAQRRWRLGLLGSWRNGVSCSARCEPRPPDSAPSG